MKLIEKFLLISIMILLFALPARAEIIETLTDDFNHSMSTDTYEGKYPATKYPSSIFVRSDYDDASYSHITKGAGPDGSTALVFNKRGDTRSLVTKEFDTTDENKVYVFSYDIKLSSNQYAVSIGGKGISTALASNSLFKFDTDGYIKYREDNSSFIDTDAMAYSADTWYHVVIMVQGTSKCGWIYDDNGNISYSNITESTGKNICVFNMTYKESGKIVLTVDNAKLVAYDASTQKPDIISETVSDGEENVPRNIPLTFVLDQKFTEGSTVTFTKGEDGTVPVAGAVCTIKRHTNTIEVTYPGLLERDTQYTLSFSSVTNGMLSATDTITFRTEDLHPLNDIVISTAVPNSEDSTKTDITFSFGDPLNYPDFTGAALAVVYQGGKMISADMVSLSGLPMGETTQSFALGTLPVDSEIKLILLDTQAHPIPLASGSLAN